MVKSILAGAALFLAGLVLGVVLLRQPGQPIGASAGPEHSVQQFFRDGFSAGTQAGITQVDRIQCGTATVNPANLEAEAFENFAVTVTGVSNTANQVYFGGLATSTLPGVFFTAKASGTTVIMLQIHSASGTAATNITTTTASACYLQF